MVNFALLLFILVFSTVTKAEELRDPTQPLYFSGGVEKKTRKLVLQAIYQRKGGNVAIINGTTSRVGDLVGAARVVKISATSVSVDESGKATTLYLRPSIR